MAETITVHLQVDTAECPVCGKMFTPAPEHALKIGEAFSSKKVCSYSCMRKWEKENYIMRREEVKIHEQERTRKSRKRSR